MNSIDFEKIARELFGAVLEPYGFTTEGSRHCTFHRKVNNEIFNVIIPDLGSNGVWYDIKVAPLSPALDPLFEERYPDNVGIYTDAYLSRYCGVGQEQQKFNCKYAENFRRIFENEVRDLIAVHAINYLENINTVSDLLHLIKHDLVRGFALHYLGRHQEARPILEAQKKRFSNSNDPNVKKMIKYLDKLLD